MQTRRVGVGRRRTGPAGGWERAIAWALQISADPSAVYLDTETTGLGYDDEIVDLAVVGADGAILIDTLVQPSRSIPAGASAVHGLTDRDVAAAPTWSEIYPLLLDVVVDRVVVVYNAEFDCRMVSQTCSRCSLGAPVVDWQCAMRAYAEFHGELGRGGGFRWHSLERAVRTFGAAPGGHRALADALACRAVVLGMASMAR